MHLASLADFWIKAKEGTSRQEDFNGTEEL